MGELSADNQAKLLRFLAQGTYWPVGGTTERRADVRIISATHRDVGGGSDAFREDLYYRLSVITIRIPRLEAGDVESIARSLVTQLADHHGVPLEDDDVAAVAERCAGREWNGGARELRNTIERLMVLWSPDRQREELFAEVLGEQTERAGLERIEHPELPLANARVSKDLDSLVFLGIAAQCGDVKELAHRTERTVQAVYGRLKKLGLGPRSLGRSSELDARMQELRRRVAPELPWIRALLSGS